MSNLCQLVLPLILAIFIRFFEYSNWKYVSIGGVGWMLATFHVVYFILYKVQPRFKTSSAQETFVQGSSNISNEDYILKWACCYCYYVAFFEAPSLSLCLHTSSVWCTMGKYKPEKLDNFIYLVVLLLLVFSSRKSFLWISYLRNNSILLSLNHEFFPLFFL